jgi:class 3 adenylate cyclase
MPSSNGKLIVREAGQAPREFELAEAAVTIGRDAGCDLVVASRYVSRRHCRVEPTNGAYTLVELGSANPTVINGQKVEGSRVLAPGDTINIADVTIEFQRAQSDPNATEVFMVPTTAGRLKEVEPELTTSEKQRVKELFGLRGTLTMMFTDLQDSTKVTASMGDDRAQEFLRQHNAILREQIAVHQGLEVKGQGDGFMVAFTSARAGVRCAVAIQRKLSEYNSTGPELPIIVRIGLNLGEVIAEEDDFFGTAVILAARIASRAHGQEILISELLNNIIASTGEFKVTAMGSVRLKGFPKMHKIFRIEWLDPGITGTN